MTETPRITLAEQIAEVERNARALQRFPGRMSAETVARKVAHLDAAATTLRYIERHAEALRRLLAACCLQTQAGLDWSDAPALIADLKHHPAVVALLDEYPDAIITGVRAIAAGADPLTAEDA